MAQPYSLPALTPQQLKQQQEMHCIAEIYRAQRADEDRARALKSPPPAEDRLRRAYDIWASLRKQEQLKEIQHGRDD